MAHTVHDDQQHEHGPNCGHAATEHDGHRHALHDGHWDEH